MKIPTNEIAGLAALAICESLLLALVERRTISEADKGDLLSDAALAHRNAAAEAGASSPHSAVAALLERMRSGKNGTYAAAKDHG